MNLKPAKNLISLEGHTFGLAAHYRWEKEVLVDYIAYRLRLLEEDITEHAKTRGSHRPEIYEELCQIARTLRKHPGVGLHVQMELECRFFDIRDFVTWNKGELADYLIHQIIATNLVDVAVENRKLAEEVSAFASAILLERSFEDCVDAEVAAEQQKFFNQAVRANQLAASRDPVDGVRNRSVSKPKTPHTSGVSASNVSGAPSPTNGKKLQVA